MPAPFRIPIPVSAILFEPEPAFHLTQAKDRRKSDDDPNKISTTNIVCLAPFWTCVLCYWKTLPL
jgi:hypothetical protein